MIYFLILFALTAQAGPLMKCELVVYNSNSPYEQTEIASNSYRKSDAMVQIRVVGGYGPGPFDDLRASIANARGVSRATIYRKNQILAQRDFSHVLTSYFLEADFRYINYDKVRLNCYGI